MGVSLFEMLTGKKVFGDPNDLPGDMRAKLMALRQNVERTPVHPRGAGVRPGGCQAIGFQIKASIWEGRGVVVRHRNAWCHALQNLQSAYRSAEVDPKV